MMVHVSLRRTHHELAKRQCQRLRIDMNHHVHPSEAHRGELIFAAANPMLYLSVFRNGQACAQTS